jgi:DNA-binding response OmpR family regulator
MLRAVRPDLLVLGLLLPDMDGLALLRRIRAGTLVAGTPPVVIMVSALQAELRALQAGADAFMHKPVKGSHLVDMARELLSRSHRAT